MPLATCSTCEARCPDTRAAWCACARRSPSHPSRGALHALRAGGSAAPRQDPFRTAYDRQDSFYRRAQREGLRSRAAYKLAEIQRREGLLRADRRVVDLGCWPGGWLQVAVQAVGAGGRVVGVDLAEVEPLANKENAIAIQADLCDPATPGLILEALGGLADVVLSDAAPKLTGVRATDRAREEQLLEAVAALIPQLLRPGGDLLVKLLEGPEAQAAARRWQRDFERTRTLRPAASRRGSSERYLLGRGYRTRAGGEPAQRSRA